MKNLRDKYSFRFGQEFPLILAITLLFPFLALAQTTQTPDTAKTRPGAQAYVALEMLTPNEGVDFNAYLKSVYLSVKREWLGYQMPPSIEKGERGIVRVEFRVRRDGTVPADSMKLASGSGRDDFDRAAKSAIQATAPFSTLPSKFSQPFIELRMTFFYNIDPAKLQRP